MQNGKYPKKNEADDTWYHFEKTSFDGSADVVINVDAHEGSSVRTGIIVLSTKAAEGATPAYEDNQD